MMLELIAPLLHSVLITATPEPPRAAETKSEKHIEKSTTNVACNCVAFVRTLRPDIPFKDASQFKISTTTPYVGAVALLYYPRSGLHHLAYVEEVGEGWIRVADANYSPCSVTHRKIVLPERVLGYI